MKQLCTNSESSWPRYSLDFIYCSSIDFNDTIEIYTAWEFWNLGLASQRPLKMRKFSSELRISFTTVREKEPLSFLEYKTTSSIFCCFGGQLFVSNFSLNVLIFCEKYRRKILIHNKVTVWISVWYLKKPSPCYESVEPHISSLDLKYKPPVTLHISLNNGRLKFSLKF